MTSTLAFLDGLPLGPLALFALGYLVFLLTVLAWFRSRRRVERCDQCGAEWHLTGNGNSWHVCTSRRGLS